ncbi:hypothetical protein Pmar_PMAR020114 [Perkinsus marinus ATCC 50983]|uniref:Uncharacterized protein n=1 Tax=Perkinsus marinus (strain ATCC 50983 / TXsc) TaxID=423536 RepID=C5KWQ9_PERM5|nr:hypothetical protein Pmar_PMAR020114 [Perkinsus marinus ATCC 50983]EER11134.1 hypothetical protein Pmar_PMAR020114 [Perkinsus marinus ATCC 50983]|eukprot:XP_002779339.1 hypothetical protein Pmar_PMAR020114 [Perkinsus marinus ATCC 50983]
MRWNSKNPFARFAVFKKKLTAAHVNFDRSWRPVERYLKIGSKTYVYCEGVSSGPSSKSDKWKLRVTCTKENSKKTRAFDIEFKNKDSATSFATIWGAYTTEVPIPARMIKDSTIQAAEVLVSPATGRARKRVLRLGDKKPRICRGVADVLYKGDAADVVAECDKQLLTIPFGAYQRAEKFAAVWGGFKKVDADIVEKCSKMEIAGHPDDIVRATSDVVSLGRKIAAGRLETSDGSMLRCARVSEPVSYEGGIDKYVVKTKCQGRTTKVICDDEDAAWRFSAQWSHFRAGVSTNLGLVSASKRVDVHHNGKRLPFTLVTANIESHVTSQNVRMRWLGLRYAGTSIKDDLDLSRQWFVCSRVKNIKETDGGEFHVVTTCGLSIRNRIPTPEHSDNEVDVVFTKRDEAYDFAMQWGQYNPVNARDVGVMYATEPVVDLVTAGFYRDTFSGKLTGRVFTTRDTNFECGAISALEQQTNGDVHIRTECSAERKREYLPSADTTLAMKRAEAAVKWAVKWGDVANPEIHMAAAMVSGASANVEGQVTGTVSIAKLVYAPTGALHSRVIEINDDSDKVFVYNCEGVSSDIAVQGTSQELGVAFARYFGGMHNANIESDAEFIGSCPSAVIGTGGVHELKHARLREETGTGEVKRILVVRHFQARLSLAEFQPCEVHGEEKELSCSNIVNPPQFDDGVYKISVICESKPVTITCTDSDPAVLLATRWGAYPRSELGVELYPGVCSSARLGNDEGWTVTRQTVTMTGASRSFVVEKAGTSTQVTCDGLQQNPQIVSDGVEISIDCREGSSGTPKKLELLCSTPFDAIRVCKGPLFEKQDAVVEVGSRVRSACDTVTVSGQSTSMHLTSASIQGTTVVVDVAAADESNAQQFSCTHFFGSPEATDHQTLVLRAQCGEEILNFECKDTAAALQLATFGQIDQPAIALQQGLINSCAEVKQEGISNAFTLSKATYRPSFVKTSGYSFVIGSEQDLKRWLTITLRNDDEPGYEDSDFLLSCNAVGSSPEPLSALDRSADKYKVTVDCESARGTGGNTKVEVLCDDFHNAMQLATVWGSLDSSQPANIELKSLHTHLKAAWLDTTKVEPDTVRMFVARPEGEKDEGSILQASLEAIRSSSYKCDPNAAHRVYFKQFFYYVTMHCNELSQDKVTLGEPHKVTLIANNEEAALTIARAFAKIPVDKVWIDHTLYFAGEEGATMIGDTQTALTEAYVKVFPREYLLDFSGAFQYSCNEASQAPKYTSDNRYEVTLTCGKRDDDDEPEQKDQVVTIAFSTDSKAIGFSNAFGGLLYHEVEFDSTILHTVDYISLVAEQHMQREEIYPLKRATVEFDLNGRLTSRRIEFLRADEHYGGGNGKRTYHPVKFECDEELLLDRKADTSGRIIAATVTATCVETYGGFHQQHSDKIKVAMAFRRSPDAAEPFMNWWRGNFKVVDNKEVL